MTNVITLPEREKLPESSQRQRVFYLGFVYRGPPLMQEVQDVYLKRHGRKEGTRRWSIITYSKYFEWDVRNYSLELANCAEDDVPDMIDEWYKPDEVTFEDLWEMGWTVTFQNGGTLRCMTLVLGQFKEREEYEDKSLTLPSVKGGGGQKQE